MVKQRGVRASVFFPELFDDETEIKEYIGLSESENLGD